MVRLLSTAALVCAPLVVLGQDTTRASLESSFAVMVSGRFVEAEAGFIGATATSKEGSAERWIAQEMAKLCRVLDDKKAKGVDAVAFQEGFRLLLDGKPIDAQVSFLKASAPFGDNNINRSLGRTLSDISVSYGQQTFIKASDPNNPQSNTGATSAPTSGSSRQPDPTSFQKNAGRFEVIIDGAVFGAFTAITGAVLLGLGDSEDDGPALTLLSVGGAAGGGLLGNVYANAHKEPMRPADASPISIGGALGAAQGAFAVALFGLLDGEDTDVKEVFGTIWVSSAIGFAGGVLTTEIGDPSRGDPYLVASSALWGTGLSLGILGIVQPSDAQSLVSTLTVGYDAGIVGGVVLASMFDTSTNRLKTINAYGGAGFLGGALAGGLIAGAIGADGNEDAALGIFSTMAMVGGAGGLLYGFYRSSGSDNGFATNDPPRAAAPKRLSFQGVSPMMGKTPDRPTLLNATFQF